MRENSYVVVASKLIIGAVIRGGPFSYYCGVADQSTVYPGAKRPRTFFPFTGLKDWRALAGPEDNAMTDRSAGLERNGRRLGRIEFEMMTVTLWVLAGAVIALFFLS